MEAELEDRVLGVLKNALQTYDGVDVFPIQELQIVDGELLFTADLGGDFDFAIKVEEV